MSKVTSLSLSSAGFGSGAQNGLRTGFCTLCKSWSPTLGQVALLWEIASAWLYQEFLKLRHLEGLISPVSVWGL